jgi:ABC-2 type transport system permease protein
MRGYGALVSARFRTLLQYRSAAVAGFTTQIFFGLVFIMVFEAFFESSSSPQPMSQVDVITYIWLGQAFIMILPWNVDRDLQTLVRSGGVAYELLRPMDLYSAWFSRAIALRTAPAIMRSVPLLVIAALFLDLSAPESLSAGLAFGITMIGAVLLSAAITNFISISLMWTVSGEGVSGLAPAVVMVFSGMIVPIPFFPDWAQTMIRIMPFSGLVDTPYRLYLGHLPASDLGMLLGHQLLWTLAFILLGRWMLSRGLRRLTVQGG